MDRLHKTLQELGTPYEIKSIDLEEVIYRKLETGFEFEVSGIYGNSRTCTLYVWSVVPRKIISIYQNIPLANLKDVLGYYACVYQKLTDQFQVERQDIEV
ncbi:MAG: hypothetical protein PHV18_11125 [Lachnospiraceae bacterium]|nr:hypothetical protein [Lachnospiraceae bacterium]